MSLNVIDCTVQYKLPDVTRLYAHSSRVLFRMCKPIKEVHDFILYLLKCGVDVYIKVVESETSVKPYNILDSNDLYEVFEILTALSEKEER